MNRIRSALSGAPPPILNVCTVWLIWLVAITVCFYHTNITFLRAESGWFQFMVRQHPTVYLRMLRGFLTHSDHGHYVPFALMGELELTYLVGPHQAFWKWRHLVVLSVLATCLFAIVYRISRERKQFGDLHIAAVAFGVTALFIFQPLMGEFVAWPRLILQLNWMILSALSLLFLVRWIEDPLNRKSVWLAALFAYGSMHFYGGGLATVLAFVIVIGFFLAANYSGKLDHLSSVRGTLIAVLTITSLLALGHTACMHFLRAPYTVPADAISVDGRTVLGYIPLAFIAALHALISFSPSPSFQLMKSLWPWAIILSAAWVLILTALARSYLQQPTTDRLVHFALHGFSMVGFYAFILLLAARHLIEPGSGTIDFTAALIGGRYLVPANFMVFGSVAAVAMTFAHRTGRSATLLFVLIALGTLIANEQGRTTNQNLWPGGATSHAKAWRALVSLTRECRAANLPVPNLPMGELTQEFRDWDLKLYAPLLRHSLHLSPQEKIEFQSWEKLRGKELKQYEIAAPSLGPALHLLRVRPPGT